jgi:hypothetical protein
VAQNNTQNLTIRLGTKGISGVRTAFRSLQNVGKGLKSQFDRINRSADGLRKTLSRIDAAAKLARRAAFASGAAVGGVVAGALVLAQGAATRADEQIKEARTLGLTVEEYGRLLLAAEQAGLKSTEFGNALSRLNEAAFEAATGNEAAAEKFAQLGISAVDSEGELRPIKDILFELADAFKVMPEGTEKSAIAMELVGSRGRKMINFLNNGADGLESLGRQADATGTIFSTEGAVLAETYNDTIDRITRSIRGIRDQIGMALLPVLLDGARGIESFVQRNNDAIVTFAVEKWLFAIQSVEDILAVLRGAESEVKTDWVRVAAQDFRDLQTLFTGSGEEIENEFIRGARDQLLELRQTIADLEADLIRMRATALELYTVLSGEGQGLDDEERGIFIFAKNVRDTYDKILEPIFSKIGELLDSFAIKVNEFFGLEGEDGVTGTQVGLALVFAKYTGVIQLAIGIAGVAVDAFKVLLGIGSFLITRILIPIIGFLVGVFGAIPVLIGAAVVGAVALVVIFADDMKELLGSAVEWIGDKFEWLGGMISGIFSSAFESITGLWEGAKGIFSAAGDILGFSSGDSETPTASRSAGGLLRGPGSGTSDSILARVSNGEYVVRAAAVRRLGHGVLDSINRGVLPAFATGGLVGALPQPILSGADYGSGGGMGSGGRPVILNLPDGGRVGLRGDGETVADLEKRLRRSATSQTARKPGWYK